ncbi:MAG: glutamate-5-semialdehyde dehydrogenase, partial [Bacteroidota bacterium]
MISTEIKNNTLKKMIQLLDAQKALLIEANQKDLDIYNGEDQAFYDRLVMNEQKIQSMQESLKLVIEKKDPVGKVLYEYLHPKGMEIKNCTSPFGTILIIYESRPDVTIEAAALAFKAGNKILLKGGKEAKHSNLA